MDMIVFVLVFGTIWGVSAVWNILSPKSREMPHAAWTERLVAVGLIVIVYSFWLLIWMRWTDPMIRIVSVFVVALLFTFIQIGLQIYSALRKNRDE